MGVSILVIGLTFISTTLQVGSQDVKENRLRDVFVLNFTGDKTFNDCFNFSPMGPLSGLVDFVTATPCGSHLLIFGPHFKIAYCKKFRIAEPKSKKREHCFS